MLSYGTERVGQIAFYETFIPRVDPNLESDGILADDNDGVINGNLLEFKLRVADVNAALLQCVKHLSARHLKGKPIPSNIAIISLEESIAYVYRSKDYLSQIETVYNGPSSKNNSGFTAGKYADRLDYSDQREAEKLVTTLKTDSHTKTHIDENELLIAWFRVLEEAREMALYDSSLTYGLYQIGEELNAWHEQPNGNRGRIYDYPSLNGAIRTLSQSSLRSFSYEPNCPLIRKDMRPPGGPDLGNQGPLKDMVAPAVSAEAMIRRRNPAI